MLPLNITTDATAHITIKAGLTQPAGKKLIIDIWILQFGAGQTGPDMRQQYIPAQVRKFGMIMSMTINPPIFAIF